MTRHSQVVRRAPRRGAAALGFAVVAPLLFLLILGLIEFGRLVMVQEVLTNGAREGARQAVLPSATQCDVTQTVQNYMTANMVSGYMLTHTDPATAGGGSFITVTVSVPYANVSWLPAGVVRWSGEQTLTARVVMRKEKASN